MQLNKIKATNPILKMGKRYKKAINKQGNGNGYIFPMSYIIKESLYSGTSHFTSFCNI